MTPWLNASSRCGRDIGSCTLPMSCQRFEPADWAASNVVADTPWMPSMTTLMTAGAA